MGKSIEEIFLNLESEGLFDENKTIYLLDLPNESMLNRIALKPLENEVFVFARGYNDDLRIGTTFDVIFPRKQIDDYLECTIELKYVSVNPKYDTDYLPKGYSGICLLKFSKGLPVQMLSKLANYDEKKDFLKHDKLILTQKKGFNKLLNVIKAV